MTVQTVHSNSKPNAPRKNRPPTSELNDQDIIQFTESLLNCKDTENVIAEIYSYCKKAYHALDVVLYLVDGTQVVLAKPNCISSDVVQGKEHTTSLVGYIVENNIDSFINAFSQIDNQKTTVKQRFEDQKIGVIALHSKGTRYAFLEMTSRQNATKFDHCKDIQRFGGIIKNVLSNCQRCYASTQAKRYQSALLAMLKSVANEESLLKLIDSTLYGAKEITSAERALLLFVDWEEMELWPIEKNLQGVYLPLGNDLLAQVATEGKPIQLKRTDQVCKDIKKAWPNYVIENALYFPIGSKPNCGIDRKCIAVLILTNKLGAAEFSNDDFCGMEAFAAEFSVALRRRTHEMDYLRMIADLRIGKANTTKLKSHQNLLEMFTSVRETLQNGTAKRLETEYLARNRRYSIVHEDWPASCSMYLQTSEIDRHTSLKEQIPDWNFNVFDSSSHKLLVYAERMFLFINIVEEFEIVTPILRNFILAIRQHYHQNPFHNFLHGFSVLHATYLILSDEKSFVSFTSLEKLACMIAALCHDVDHPGHSNKYEVSSKSDLALRYNDDSVLERHHAATTFRILRDEADCDIFFNLSTNNYSFVRKLIIDAILGTDMLFHFEQCMELEKLITRESCDSHVNLSSPLAKRCDMPRCSRSSNNIEIKSKHEKVRWALPNSEDRQFLIKVIVHAADLSGQVFARKVALKWSNAVTLEFTHQAFMEHKHNLDVSYKSLHDPATLLKGQHFFASHIVAPLWRQLVQVFPSLNVCVDNVSSNVEYYSRELDRVHDAVENDICTPVIPGKSVFAAAKFRSSTNVYEASPIAQSDDFDLDFDEEIAQVVEGDFDI